MACGKEFKRRGGPRTPVKLTLVYDADCGPCTKFRGAVGFLDPGRRMGYAGLAEAEREGLLDAVPRGRRRSSFHLVGPPGEVLSGADALPALLAQLPGGPLSSAALARCPPAFASAAFVYGVFSRLHGTGRCGKAPRGAGGGRPRPDIMPLSHSGSHFDLLAR